MLLYVMTGLWGRSNGALCQAGGKAELGLETMPTPVY